MLNDPPRSTISLCNKYKENGRATKFTMENIIDHASDRIIIIIQLNVLLGVSCCKKQTKKKQNIIILRNVCARTEINLFLFYELELCNLWKVVFLMVISNDLYFGVNVLYFKFKRNKINVNFLFNFKRFEFVSE